MEVETDKPIFLILTKKDLEDLVEGPVRIATLRQASKDQGFQGAMATSSKLWEDFNVHKAFVKTIETGLLSKDLA